MNDENKVSLATLWGWHFHHVLRDLREQLAADLEKLGNITSCKPSPRIELFRRTWPASNTDDFWFRWSFFEPGKAEDYVNRFSRWRGDCTITKDKAGES